MKEEKLGERKQRRQFTYNVTLCRIGIAILQRKQQCILCVLLSCMSLSTVQIYWRLYNSAFMVNLCHR